jgi:probable DNA metabolism protein
MTIVARLSHPADFDGWRALARRLAAAAVAPDAVEWRVGDDPGGLFDGDPLPEARGERGLIVPRGFLELGRLVVLHSDPQRFGLLYRLLLRLQGERALLQVATDPDIRRAEMLAKAVRRDLHKMTAFVRFRLVRDAEDGEAFIAWFEPEHHILEAVAPFFVRRFAGMRWSILTPRGSLVWDGGSLRIGEAAQRTQAPGGDAMEDWWRTYYAAIFNPARLNSAAMRAEMPVKYWRNLPEAELIAPLIAEASRRTDAMIAAPASRPERRPALPREALRPLPAPVEEPGDLREAAAAARDCRRCGLWCDATQTVFGEGPPDAPLMIVGEQPGDREDLAGRPFVGPAGELFDRSMARVGLDRRRAYVTNAVKHFRFTLRGKRRIHQKPGAGEIDACRSWLTLELGLVRPRLVLALGGTALRALTGETAPLSGFRGRRLALADGTPLVATVHPSYLLRLPDEAARQRETERFLADLGLVHELLPAMRLQAAA